MPGSTLHPGTSTTAGFCISRNSKKELQTLAANTGNSHASAPVKLRAARIDPAWFPIGAYGDEAPQRDRLAQLALKRASEWRGQEFARERVFVIGDTPADIACARAIQARAIAITTGYSPREDLVAAQPDVLVDSFHELGALLD